MELAGKKVIALGERDGVPGQRDRRLRALGRGRGRPRRDRVLRLNGRWGHGPRRTRIASRRSSTALGADDLVVVLGAADPEALEVAAETVTAGDPSYVGPLAGVSLGLPVVHIFEDEVKEQVDPSVYEEQVGLLELALDTDAVKEVDAQGSRLDAL